MKKLNLKLAWLCLVLIFFIKQNAAAQYIVNGKEIDTTFQHTMNTVFGNLNKSFVPYGLLKDYAIEFSNLKNYDGAVLTDSNKINKGIWYDMYNTLISSRVTATAYTSLPNANVADSIWTNKGEPGTVVIGGLFYQYAYLDSTALANNKITVSGNQLFDKYIGGVWQNPYLTNKVIGFAPATEDYLGQNFDVVLPDSLWLSNSKGIVNHIEIDPGDGLGYRTITPDVPLSVAYPDTGLKVWNFKVYLTNSTVLVTHSRMQINQDVYGQNDHNTPFNPILATNGISPGHPPGTSGFYYINSTETFNGEHALGAITIQYADPTTHSIHKPLIVAEGFDYGVFTKPKNTIGEYSISNFKQAITATGSTTLTNLMSEGINNYDIIFIDFSYCTKDLRLNALIVKDVIRWVNARKQPLPGHATEKNVVMGLSEGGVIARYAMKKMEDASESIDTRLFVSVDAPQQGSLAPYGFQNALNHFNNFYVRLGDIPNLYNLFHVLSYSGPDIASGLNLGQSMAAKQMLQYHLDENDQVDNSTHIAWQNELTTLGYPSCRNVAISNGSECGLTQPGVGPGSQILGVDGEMKSTFLGDLVSAFVLPALGTATKLPQLSMGSLPGGNRITQ